MAASLLNNIALEVAVPISTDWLYLRTLVDTVPTDAKMKGDVYATRLTPTFLTNITTPLIKSAGTLILQTNGSTTALTLGTDQDATFAGSVATGVSSPLVFRGSTSLRDLNVYAQSSFDNYPSIIFYPNSGTNSFAGVSVSPRGTGGTATVKSEVSFFNTDYVADATNFEDFKFRAAGTNGYGIVSEKGGTGTIRAIWIDASGSITPATSNAFFSTTGNTGLGGNVSPGARLDITAAANTTALKSTGYSLTGSSAVPMVDLAGEWNSSGVITAFKLNITNTVSGAGSSLMDLQFGGVSKWNYGRFGMNLEGVNGFSVVNSVNADPNLANKEFVSFYYIGNVGIFESTKIGSGTVRELSIRTSGSAPLSFYTNNISRMFIAGDGSLNFAEALNLVVGSTTGTKIGTATTQKLGFWDVTPVVQQVFATGASHTVDETITLLQTLGLCKQS